MPAPTDGTKTSLLTDGVTAQTTDEVMARRGAGNVRLTIAYIKTTVLSGLGMAWSAITGKPTTLAGFGIVDAEALGAAAAEAALRAAADTTLQTNITSEASTRATADSTHAALTTSAHGGIVASTDPRLTDSRTPTAHAIGGALHTGSLTDALHGSLSGGTLHPAVIAAGASGFMAGADKTKLDGVAAGAQVGTVTSAGITQPAAGITASGSPITTAGNVTLALANDLAALEGLSGTGVAQRTGVDTWAVAALLAADISNASANGRSLITATDYAAMRTLLALVIGTNVQAWDADLDAIAALTTTAFGRSYLALADAAAGRTLAASAPRTATYITQTADGELSAEQALGSLASGYLKNTTTTGVLSVQAAPIPIGDLPTSLAVIGSQALTDAATVSWDTSLGAFATLTIGGNRTLANPTNLKAGASYAIKITQDGTGSRTLAYGSVYKWVGGAPVLSTAIGAVDIITFISDGTNMYGSILKAFA